MQNSLKNHFRQPKLFIQLPSNGNFWPINSLNLPENKEIPVMSMTGKDDIMIRNADALMTGQATVEMIQSCCPNIKNAWNVPRCDLDVILLAIRIATFGSKMETESTCPHCKNVNNNDVDLRWVMDNIKQPDWNQTMFLDNLTFVLRPTTYRHINSLNIDSYEESKLLKQLSQPDLTDELRAQLVTGAMRKLAQNLTQRISYSIVKIISEDGSSTDEPKEIIEFLENTDKETFDKIRKIISDYVKDYSLPKLKVECENCKQVYDATIEFDPANFFGPNS